MSNIKRIGVYIGRYFGVKNEDWSANIPNGVFSFLWAFKAYNPAFADLSVRSKG